LISARQDRGAHHHAALPSHIVARPEPIEGEAFARPDAELDGEFRAAAEHLAGQIRVPGHVQHRVFHAPQPPVHLEDAGRDIAADEEVAAIKHHRIHQCQQFFQPFGGELVRQHLLARDAGQREPRNLVEAMPPQPCDAPPIPMRFAVPLMNDPFHGVVIVDPGLPDVVPHGVRNGGNGNLQQTAKLAGGIGMEPHEDRDTVHRLLAQRGIDALFRSHRTGSSSTQDRIPV
jgi:hypothetical protein